MKKFKIFFLVIIFAAFLILFKMLIGLNSTESDQIKNINKIEKNGIKPFFLVSEDNPYHKIFDSNKAQINIDIFKDRIIILNFWASWCESCVEEFPSLIKLLKRNKNIVLIAVSLDDSQTLMKDFASKNNMLSVDNLFLKYDDDTLRKYFSIIKIPETYIFSKNFKFEKKVVGSIDWSAEEIYKFFKDLEK